MDDPYKFVRDIILSSEDVTRVIPKTNIWNVDIPESFKKKPPYIRLTVLDMPDVQFGDGQVLATGLYIQIDIWQATGLMTVGNAIKRILKENDFGFIDMMEPQTERISDNVTLFRDARRYFYAQELKPEERY